MQDLETVGMVRAMMVRTRFIDEVLSRAIAGGATQVLVLGAGLDSHAYRCRELLASSRVFEVDRPATLAWKQRRVDEALGGPPGNLTYVPLDLQESLSATLARHGYDLSLRSFILMEGVSMYLPDEVLRATFRFIAAHAPGSSCVFDFATTAMVEGIQRMDLASAPPAARASMERFLDMIRDEPWLSGLALDTEQQYLAELGLALGELLVIGGPESVARYLTRPEGTVVGAEAQARGEAMRKAAVAKFVEQATPEQRQLIEQKMREQERQMSYRIAEAVVPQGN
jgi:methyltransferase (TIGR00027 family)